MNFNAYIMHKTFKIFPLFYKHEQQKINLIFIKNVLKKLIFLKSITKKTPWKRLYLYRFCFCTYAAFWYFFIKSSIYEDILQVTMEFKLLLLLTIIYFKLKMKKICFYYGRQSIQISMIIERQGGLITNLWNQKYIRLSLTFFGHIRCLIFAPRHPFRVGDRLIGNKFIIESFIYF